MLLSAMVGVVSFADTTPTAEAKLNVSHANLVFEDAVYPLIAADYTAVYTGDKAATNAAAAVKLEVYKGDELIETLSPTTDDVDNPAGTVAFKQKNIGLKNMGDIYTYRAINNKAEKK